jgi:hypothetical protein
VTHISLCSGQDFVITDPKIPGQLTTSATVIVPVLSAGGGIPKIETLFFKDDTVKQFQRLQEGKHHIIQGPPGIGKSMLGLLWVLHCHFQKQKCVLYVTCSPGVVINVLFLSNGCPGHVRQWEYSECNIDLVMETAYNFKVPSLLVVDGLVNIKSLTTGTNPWFTCASSLFSKGKISQVILLSSVQVDIADYEWSFKLEPLAIRTQSWTLEDFLTICLKEEYFWKMVLDTVPEVAKTLLASASKELEQLTSDELHEFKKALLTEKFYFSGGSARWMFRRTINEIRRRSDDALAKVASFSVLVTGDMGEGAPGSINRLYQTRIDEKGALTRFFVSQYVSRKIFTQHGGTAANVMWNWALVMNNPSVLGWAYEAKFFASWKNSGVHLDLVYLDTITMEERSGGTLRPVIGTVEHQSSSLVPSEEFVVLSYSIQDGEGELHREDKTRASFKDLHCFVVPEQWNQGLFDFAVATTKDLYVIQCTLQEKHNRLISHMDPLIHAFQKHGFVFQHFHLVGCSDKKEFKFIDTHEVSRKASEIQCWRSLWLPA